jgi:chromosome segregation ATPase
LRDAGSWLVINIQSIMFVVLGFLVASLFVLLIAPAYRRRIVRLTTEEIRRAIPITEAEIRADKDRLRAQYAIRVHKLEAQAEQQRLAAARQMVELNQRDARIAALEAEIERFQNGLEENANARRVLEHTVTDRMPRLEQRLAEVRELLAARDSEVVTLKSETTRSIRALDEAMQINAQQRSELERMSSVLATRSSAASDARFDAEIALRAEIEALRATTREQSALISQLQSNRGHNSGDVVSTADSERLARDLANAEAALNSARATAEADGSARATAEAQLTELRAKLQDQAAEVARLTAALAAYEEGEGKEKSGILRDSKIAAKARVNSLQAQLQTQSETIQRLRAELAASNERLARQASHFMEEMRRLGAGTRPVSGDARRSREAPPARSLADRLGQARQSTANGTRQTSAERGKVAQYLKSLEAANETTPASAGANAETITAETTVVLEKPEDARSPVAAGAAGSEPLEAKPKRKSRLLDRISGIGKA